MGPYNDGFSCLVIFQRLCLLVCAHLCRYDDVTRERLPYDSDGQRWDQLTIMWQGEVHKYRNDCKTQSASRAAGESFDGPAWRRLIHLYRNQLLLCGQGAEGSEGHAHDPTDPSNELRFKASALYHAFYTDASSRPCGRCDDCTSRRMTYERKFSFVWAVAGDILCNLKQRNMQAKKPREALRAPMVVERSILQKRWSRQRRAEAAAERLAIEEADCGEADPHDL